MNDEGLLIEMPDGTFVLKAIEELQPGDKIVFDGPNAFSSLEDAQAELDAEIAAAGGIEAWRTSAPS